jgi:putative membrane protein
MEGVLQTLFLGLPVFLGHFGVALLMLGIGVVLYLLITPVNEYRLIKEGNTSAALTLGAAMLGISISLGAALAGSVNLWDIVIWGSVAILLQLVVFFLVDRVLSDLAHRIRADEMSAALILASTKLSIALLNAAAIGY